MLRPSLDHPEAIGGDLCTVLICLTQPQVQGSGFRVYSVSPVHLIHHLGPVIPAF